MVAASAPAETDLAPPPAIEARGVRVEFGDRSALRGVDLTVANGARVALMGPNGAGKTTLLRVMAGLLRPTSGELRIGGETHGASGPAIRARIGVLGHQSYLYPELTVWENLRLFGHLYRVPNWTSRAEDVLQRVGLLHRRTELVEYLSRGMIQRVNLARAILHDPLVLLLDEPDAGLDASALDALEAIFSDAHCSRANSVDRPRTIVFTTHDTAHAARLADRIVTLGDGRIVEQRPTGDRGTSWERVRDEDSLSAATTRPEIRSVSGA